MVQCWAGTRQGPAWSNAGLGTGTEQWQAGKEQDKEGAAAPTPLQGGSKGHMCPGRQVAYPKDGPGIEIPLVPVKEQKVVREEEDVDAQPSRLRGESRGLVRDPSPGPPSPHSTRVRVQPEGMRTAGPLLLPYELQLHAQGRDMGPKVGRGVGVLQNNCLVTHGPVHHPCTRKEERQLQATPAW